MSPEKRVGRHLAALSLWCTIVDMEQHSGQNQWRWQVVLALLGILCVGFFLRSVHFSDWLHFELDQARDARVIDGAAKGHFLICRFSGRKQEGHFSVSGPFFMSFSMCPVSYSVWIRSGMPSES